MRINVYSQELTPEVLHVEKESNTGRVYQAAQLILHSSDRLHHPPEDDDRSAVTFWLPTSEHRREEMAQAFERIAAIFRGDAALQAQQPGAQAVAWHTDDHLTDKSATTYDPVIADRWRAKGWPVTPHYTHPQPPSIPEPSDADVRAFIDAVNPMLHPLPPPGVIRAGLATYAARLRERIGANGESA